MSDTFFRKQINTDAASFLLLTTPFFPKVTRKASEGDEPSTEFDVVFNQAYVFDYANGGKKIKVEKRDTHTIDESTRYRFWLKITVDHINGQINKAEIEKKSGDSPSDAETDDPSKLESNISNFYDYDMISPIPDNMLGGPKKPAYFSVEICEFDKGELKELYLRENIHFHHKGMQQRTNGYPLSFGVLNGGASSVSMFNCVRAANEYIDGENYKNNKLVIFKNNNDIIFYVEGDSGGTSSG